MSKKTKLIVMISSFCFVLATCLFSVFAVKTFSFNMGGSVEFVAPGVNATVSAATLSGISSKTTGKMQSFSVTRDDTATTIAAKEGVQSWSGLQLLFDDDSEGKATIKFTITNTSDKAIENIMVKLSTSTTNSSAIQATPSADFCIAPGGAHEFTITFSVADPEISAKLDDFGVTVELKAIKTSEIPSVAEQQTSGLNFTPSATGNTASFTSYTGSATSVEIPATVKDASGKVYTVTEIADASSESESPFVAVKSTLKSVTFPSTLTKIGDYAFANCQSLSGDLVIPEGVTSIGMQAFLKCFGLNRLTLPNTLKIIGSGAFEDCGLLGTLTIPNGVTAIGSGAFYYCGGLTGTLIIPDSVTTLGAHAFYYCSGLTEVIIGEGVTTIGGSVFSNCGSLRSLTLGNNVTTIGDYAFEMCHSLSGNLTIPASVTTIGNGAFSECNGLSGTLVIPDTVTSLGNYAFHFCDGLSGVSFGSGIATIGEGAFMNCMALSGDLIIPENITTIGSSAFSGCSGLSSITLNKTTPPTLGANCFDDTNNATIYVPSGSVGAYKSATNWSGYSTRIIGF